MIEHARRRAAAKYARSLADPCFRVTEVVILSYASLNILI